MGREIKRVPVDFDWPTYEVWHGFLMPESLRETQCTVCDGSGWSAHAQNLQSLWYGHGGLPFDPATTGSTPWTAQTPAVRRHAEWAIERDPGFYGTGELAIAREAARLADFFNSGWCYHLDQNDVDALIEAERLYDLTHTFTPGEGWKPIEPRPTVTAAQVNEWSLTGLAHDSINSVIVIRARCKRDGLPDTCQMCLGHGSTEAYPGQRAEAEAWTAAEPPKGEGWQEWDTTSKGSPISAVFATAEDLAAWMSNPDRTDRYAKDWMPYPAAMQFIQAGWAPTFIGTAAGSIVQGTEHIGMAEQAGPDSGSNRKD